MDKRGKRLKGRMLAATEADVRTDLRKQGVVAKKVRKESQLFKSGKKVNAEDIALFARQLATMLQAGIPMVQCFDIIGNGHDKPSVQKLVLAIKSDVESGTTLHESLAKHPLYFDDLFVNLVEAGEHAGALESLLDKIATYKEKTEALKKKIKKALFYPTAVLAVAVIVTVILLIFVIPQFESLFKGFGADLPAFTQMVINLSRFVQDQGWWMAFTGRCGRVCVLLLQEAISKNAPLPGQGDAESTHHRSHYYQSGDCPLRENPFNDVCGRRAAGGSISRRLPARPATSFMKKPLCEFATKWLPASDCSDPWRTRVCFRTWSCR